MKGHALQKWEENVEEGEALAQDEMLPRHILLSNFRIKLVHDHK